MNTSIKTIIYIVFTILVALWCVGILAAPVLMHAGLNSSADIAYSVFSHVCHQSDARSFHAEGEKLGVCIRCSAIYFGFLAGLLFMPLSGALKRMQMPTPMLIITVMIPMVIDVVLNDTGLHASTTLTRVTTGLLFGGLMPSCIVPLLLEACSQLVQKHKKKIYSPDSGVYTYDRKTQ